MATILDSLVGSCAKKLQDIITDEAFLILGVKEELRELQRTMTQIQCFLNDAEQRRTEEQAVNNWFGELRDAMYDADDIIDLATFEGSKLLENDPSSPRNSTACSGISLLSCFPNIKRRHEIAVQIRNLNTRIEKISKLGGSFLTRSDAAPVGQSSTSKLGNSSHLVEPNLVGKEIKHSSRTMHRDDLIRFWVAEGFIEEQEDQLLEETAEQYYYELIYRNLLLPDPMYFDKDRCKMHDLLRQLACYLSREECFLGDPQSLEGKSMSKLRHVTVVTDKDTIVLPSPDKQQFRVRTLMLRCGKSVRVENIIFKRFVYLHVLNLSGSCVQSVPDYIGNLIHLRVLDLDRTDITCLPESIGSLVNLQILNLHSCEALHNLPSAITKLCKLRRLGLGDTPINQVPKGIGKLKFLNDLEGFPIGGGSDNAKTQDGWMLEELGHLSQLRRLGMIKLERAAPCSTDSLLIDKKHLKVLYLWCSKRMDEPYYSEEDVCNIEKIFEQLSPPHNLEDLRIRSFFGQRYPTWLGTTHLSSVKHLQLRDCNSCVYLPPIGQLPNLKYLGIEGATAVTKIGPEFVGSTEAVAFPKLEWLTIRDMPNWEEWSFVGEQQEVASPRLQLLPRLNKLDLKGCPKLRALPRQLGKEATSLRKLQLRGACCLKVVEDLPLLSEILLIEGCEGLERVSNLPQVRKLHVNCCPDLRCVVGLGKLQQLWLDKDMQEISLLWVPGLKQQCQQLHGEDLDVYTWR